MIDTPGFEGAAEWLAERVRQALENPGGTGGAGGQRGGRIVTVFAPGRIELLGKHTDYCGGRSLLCAIDRGICLAGRRRSGDLVRVTDLASGQTIELQVAPELIPQLGHWSNYPATVIRRLCRNFPGALGGAEIVLLSTLPQASGLSSSSALITGMTVLLASLYDLPQRPQWNWNELLGRPEDLAAYLGTIENGQSYQSLAGDRGVGTFGGSQDHTAMLCCREGMLSQYAFCPVREERHVPMPRDHALLVAGSGVLAEKTGQALERYNQVSLRARAIVQLWNAQTGRQDACLAHALASGPAAADELSRIVAANHHPQFGPDDLLPRLQQYREEAEQIIPRSTEAIAAMQLDAFGQLVDRSQHLAETMLGNQVPQTVYLAASARECGAVAASAFGAGFGGSVWAMVRRQEAQTVLERWQEGYRRRFPAQADSCLFFQTRPSAALRFLA